MGGKKVCGGCVSVVYHVLHNDLRQVTSVIKESSGSCQGKWEYQQRGGTWLLYDTHSITTPTLVTTLQFKYSYGSTFCHRGNELWILGGSFVHFLAVAHFISHLNFSQKVLNLFDLVISTKCSHKDLAVNYAMILFAFPLGIFVQKAIVLS